MTRIYLLLIFILTFTGVSAQRLETDIFGNLAYSSPDRDYKALLAKNIFDDLVFTDNRDNKISYKKKYLDKMFPGIRGSKAQQTELMWSLLRENAHNSKYVANYKIDIFDKVIIEDNRGYKLVQGVDIFGHQNIEEQFDGIKTSIKRNLQGYLEASVDQEKASLKKDVFDKWGYEDSLGNRFQFGAQTWKQLMHRFGSDDRVFQFLLENYFY